MSTTFLSAEWLAELATLGAQLPEVPGATVSVDHVLPGGPDGEVRFRVTYIDGRVTHAGLDGDGEAEVAITTKYPDARGVLGGDLDANAQFMSGRSKVAGPTGPLLCYLALTTTPEHAALRATLADRNEH